MKPIKRGLCGLLAALLCTASAGNVHARFVALGHVDLSFYEVTASVVQLVLERRGYNVGVQKGSHGQIYPLLGKGEVDLFVAAWLPHAHATYWDQYQDSTTKVTALYDDARLFWSVPDYVPASEVKSVADLRKPEVAAKMQKEIRGPSADSGLMIGSKKIVEAYGLGDWLPARTRQARRLDRQLQRQCCPAALVRDASVAAAISEQGAQDANPR
jgi:glycine betaine/proline transport system substrate-binding protein